MCSGAAPILYTPGPALTAPLSLPRPSIAGLPNGIVRAATPGDSKPVAWLNVSKVVKISAAYNYAVALSSNGTVLSLGGSDANYNSVDHSYLWPAEPGFVAVVAGSSFVLALHSNCSVTLIRAHGYASYYNAPALPAPPPETQDGKVVAIAAGKSFGLALLFNGTVIGWGLNDQCNVLRLPVAVWSGVTAIAASSSYALGLLENGTVVQWGCAPGNAMVPEAVRFSNVTSIRATPRVAFAKLASGTWIPWGDAGAVDNLNTSIPACGRVEVATDVAAGDFGWWSQPVIATLQPSNKLVTNVAVPTSFYHGVLAVAITNSLIYVIVRTGGL
jgi:hypothetical protein